MPPSERDEESDDGFLPFGGEKESSEESSSEYDPNRSSEAESDNETGEEDEGEEEDESEEEDSDEGMEVNDGDIDSDEEARQAKAAAADAKRRVDARNGNRQENYSESDDDNDIEADDVSNETQSTAPAAVFSSMPVSVVEVKAIDSALVSSRLTKHSVTTFSPLHENHWAPQEKGLLAIANMDSFRDSTLLDKWKHSDGTCTEVKYEWASKAHEKLYDASDKIFYAKVVPVIKIAMERPLGADVKGKLELLMENVLQARNGNETHAMSLVLHQPQMQLASHSDVRLNFGDPSRSKPYTTEQCELIVGESRYCKQTDINAMVVASKLWLRCQLDQSELRLEVLYNAEKRPQVTLTEITNDEESTLVQCSDSALAPAVRSLLCFCEWPESELKKAEIKFASRDYVSPTWSAMICLAVSGFKNYDLLTSVLVRHLGNKICRDVPDQGSPEIWIWTQKDLWDVNESALHAMLKAAATELSVGGARLSEDSSRFEVAFKSALQKYPTTVKLPKETAVQGSSAGDDQDSPEKYKNSIKWTLSLRQLSSSLANNPGVLLSTLQSIEPWISERGFAKSICTTKAIAFENGVQELTAPFDWHQPTPINRLRKRLPYPLEVPYNEMTKGRLLELQQFVIDDRYCRLFKYRNIALREADKDAVVLLGDQSVLTEASLRIRLGPYIDDVAEPLFALGVGKDAHMDWDKFLIRHMAMDQDASVLSLSKQPGKAYSCFNGIEHAHHVFFNEAQNTGHAGAVQKLNPGLLRKLLPGSSNNGTFDYRLEHGRERQGVPIKMVATMMTNKIVSPGETFERVTEISPYPTIYRTDQEEVNDFKARGYDAKLVEDFHFLETLCEQPGRTMSYLVHRAITILKDQTKAHPPTAKHKEMKSILFSLKGDVMDESEADQGLQDVIDEKLQQCEPKSLKDNGLQPTLPDCNEATSHNITLQDQQAAKERKMFQAPGKAGSKKARCYCEKAGESCHFTLVYLANELKVARPSVFSFYVKKPGQTAKLNNAVQRLLGLEQVPVKRVNGYSATAIFGWKPKGSSEEDASAATMSSSSAGPSTLGCSPCEPPAKKQKPNDPFDENDPDW